MLISQTLSPIVTPGLREALLFGGERADWERILDECGSFKHDDAVLRVLDSEARREERRREQERKLIWCMPAPACASVGRPHIFRCLFQKDIGGVSGESDPWLDSNYYALDGGTGKVQSFVDYIDSTHLVTQTTSLNQVAAPTTAAGWTGNVATFVAANSSRYVSNRTNARFKFCHAGAGFTAFMTLRLTSNANVRMLSMGNTVPTFQFYATTSANGGVLLYNDVAALFNYIPAVSWAAPNYFHFSYAESASPQGNLRIKTTSTNSGARAGLPSVANPSGTLTLGSDFGGTLPCSMEWASLYMFHRVTNTAETVVARQKIQYDTGVV